MPQRLQEAQRVELFGITPVAGCPETGCGGTGCGTTDCGTTGCTATGCGVTQCGTTGCGSTGCGTTSCGGTGCGSTGCTSTGCGQTGCGTTGCGITGNSAAPGCPARIFDPNELINPVPELIQLREQLAGITNLVKSARLVKTKKEAKEAGGVAISEVIELEKRLIAAISGFQGK